jgi:hypothetical protein
MSNIKKDKSGTYYIIYRWTRKCRHTGKIIRAKNKPFPIKIYLN